MKRTLYTATIALTLLSLAATASAQDEMVFTEFQVANATNAGGWIEVCNAGTATVDLTDSTLEVYDVEEDVTWAFNMPTSVGFSLVFAPNECFVYRTTSTPISPDTLARELDISASVPFIPRHADIQLSYGLAGGLDKVSWNIPENLSPATAATDWPSYYPDRSIELDAGRVSTALNEDRDSWCRSQSGPYNLEGDFGTPGFYPSSECNRQAPQIEASCDTAGSVFYTGTETGIATRSAPVTVSSFDTTTPPVRLIVQATSDALVGAFSTATLPGAPDSLVVNVSIPIDTALSFADINVRVLAAEDSDGDIAILPDVCGFRIDIERCGDGLLDTIAGEVCDSDSISCEDLDPISFSAGQADCLDTCAGYDLSTCEARDEGVLCFVDFDGDTYGSEPFVVELEEGENCEDVVESTSGNPLSGNPNDCDDSDDTIFPGALPLNTDVGDLIDMNCDGFDECYLDNDDDGIGVEQIIPDAIELSVALSMGESCIGEKVSDINTDCDDNNPNVPGDDGAGCGLICPDLSQDPADSLPEGDPDEDGLTNEEEAFYGTNPCVFDSDADELGDGEEVDLGTDPTNPDTDDDDLLDGEEIEIGTDPLDDDSDDDGLLDGFEIEIGTNPLNPDSDDDDLLDGQEIEIGTNPLDPDSDGDGFLDGAEFLSGFDPLSKEDFPVYTGGDIGSCQSSAQQPALWASLLSILGLLVVRRRKEIEGDSPAATR